MRGVRRATVSVAAVASLGVLAVLASCSSERTISSASSAAPVTPPASTAASDTSTTVEPATTAEAVTTTADTSPATTVPVTAPSGSCPHTETPSGIALSLTSVTGDWNGDGTLDTGLSWGEATQAGASWFVRMEVTGGTASTVPLGDLGVGFAQVLDRVDVDFSLGVDPGVNRDELLAIVGTNAAGVNLGVFGVDAAGCAFAFDNGAGARYEIPIHGAVAAMSGLTCEGTAGSQFLVRLEASSTDGTNWTTERIRVERPAARTLVDGVTLPGTMTSADPSFLQFSQAGCGGTIWVGGPGD